MKTISRETMNRYIGRGFSLSLITLILVLYGYYQFTTLIDTHKTSVNKSTLNSNSTIKQEPPARPYKKLTYNIFGNQSNKLATYQATDWRLIGIIIEPNQISRAIVLINDKEKVVKQGEKLDKNTKIDKITKDRIFVVHNNQLKVLPLYSNNNTAD